MNVCVTSLQETEGVIIDMIKSIKEQHNIQKPFIIGFLGDLGTGKTTCIRYLAQHFGYTGLVKSPTFCFMNEYSLFNSSFHTLIHIDAYRCENKQDVQTTGIEEASKKKGALVCIEWFENTHGSCFTDIQVLCSTEKDKHCFNIVW